MENGSESKQFKNFHEGIKDIVESKGYEYVGSELVSEDGRPVLRVLIDSLGGLNVKDCETVSRIVGKWLDESDPGLPDRYMLQVSSPGVERPLLRPEDFARFQGKKARVRLREAEKDRKTLAGVIGEVNGGNIIIDDEEAGSIEIHFENIAKANLVFEMPGKSKPGKKDRKRRGQQ
jgi:ribosome maturation factor RimP